MLPFSTRAAFFEEQLKDNRPLSEIEKELRSLAIDVSVRHFPGWTEKTYILKSNFGGTQESITIKSIGSNVIGIVLYTDNSEEYFQISDYVQQLYTCFPIIKKDGEAISYAILGSDLFLSLKPKSVIDRGYYIGVFKKLSQR